MAVNPLRRNFLNFAKSCILSCWLQFDNKKWGSPSSFLSYERLKVKLRVFLAGHIVAMVIYCATKFAAFCSSMIGQFVDTMIVALTDRLVIMTHQTLSLGKYWKLFSATLSIARRRLELVSKGDWVITLAARFCIFCNLSLKQPLIPSHPGYSNQNVLVLKHYKFELQHPSE